MIEKYIDQYKLKLLENEYILWCWDIGSEIYLDLNRFMNNFWSLTLYFRRAKNNMRIDKIFDVSESS